MLVACTVIAILAKYPKMPTTVPTHFNIRGEADAFGSRTSLLWIALVMAIIQTLLAWISAKPRIMNYPVSITEQNTQSLYPEGERLMVWVGLWVSILVASTASLYFYTSGGLVTAAGGVALFAVLVIGVVRIVRASGKTAGSSTSG